MTLHNKGNDASRELESSSAGIEVPQPIRTHTERLFS